MITETKAQTLEQKIIKNLKQHITEPFKIINIEDDKIYLSFSNIPSKIDKISTRNFIFNLINIDHIRKLVVLKFTKLRPKNKSGLAPLMKDYFKHRYKQDFRIFRTPRDAKKIILTPSKKTQDISNKLRQDIAMILKIYNVQNYDNVLISRYVDKKYVDITNRQIIMSQDIWTDFLKQISLIKS